MPHVLYLAHDLADPAIERRAAMLEAGGATVDVAGFAREGGTGLGTRAAIVLGPSREGRFVHRTGSVLKALLLAPLAVRALERADVIVARNLEMLLVAHRVARGRPVVYECLDVHRLLLREDALGRALRLLERRLANRSVLLLTSSPAFAAAHFRPNGITAPVQLVENRVFDPHGTPPPRDTAATPHRGPIRIGWFGTLRCRRSFDALSRFTRSAEGRFTVELHGRPAVGVLDDLVERIAAEPFMRYGGPYRYPDDLARLYGGVDLAWAVDAYEEGQNSAWLLPNRLYEAGRFGVPSIALEEVETGRFLRRHGIGVTLAALTPAAIEAALGTLNGARMAALRAAMRDRSPDLWTCTTAQCVELVDRLARLAAPRGTPKPTALPLEGRT